MGQGLGRQGLVFGWMWEGLLMPWHEMAKHPNTPNTPNTPNIFNTPNTPNTPDDLPIPRQILWERVMGLYLDECMSYEEIASRLEISPTKVKTIIRNAELLQAKKEIAEKVEFALFEGKVPLLKALNSVNLMNMFDWSLDFREKKKHLFDQQVTCKG